MAENSPKHSQETWNAIKIDFDSGNYKSVCELASRYGVNASTLQNRIANQGWMEKKKRILEKVSEKIEGKVLSKAESYLERATLRMERYEKIIDTSLENHGARDANNVPILDCEAINDYTLSETRINAMSMAVLRIPVVSQVDLTSKGQSLGDSLISAIARLRDSADRPKLTEAQASEMIDVEVLPPKGKQAD